MNRIALACIVVLIVAFGLFLLFPSPKTEFVLAVDDGKSAIVYSCDDLETEAETLVQARQSHVYFQEQLTILAKAQAAEFQEAMLEANRTRGIPNLKAIEASFLDMRRNLVAEVDEKFGCRPSGERAQ